MATGYGVNNMDLGYGSGYSGSMNSGGNAGLDSQLQSILSALGTGGAAANPLLGLATTFGGSLLQGLGGLFPSEADRKKKETYGLAKSNLNRDVYDVNSYMSQILGVLRPEINKRGAAVDKKFGLDSGAGQGEFMSQFMDAVAPQMFQIKQRNDELKSNNNNLLLQIMSSLY